MEAIEDVRLEELTRAAGLQLRRQRQGDRHDARLRRFLDKPLVKDLPRDVEGLCQGQRGRARRLMDADDVCQRPALHEFHDHGAKTVGLFEAIHRGDVRLIQRGEDPGFPAESRQRIALLPRRGGKNLDRHVAIEPGIAREVDLAHATRPNHSQDLVRADSRAGIKGMKFH